MLSAILSQHVQMKFWDYLRSKVIITYDDFHRRFRDEIFTTYFDMLFEILEIILLDMTARYFHYLLFRQPLYRRFRF